MTHNSESTQALAKDYAAKGNPNGWFEDYYQKTGGDPRAVHWADFAPGPWLVSWLEDHPPQPGVRAAVVGCGLGDDAECLAGHGCEVTAFDISPTAIRMCRERWPHSKVTYQTADLFDLPDPWHQQFDLVVECNTIQALRGQQRADAVPNIAQLIAPNGMVLVSCRSRDSEDPQDILPLPLSRNELNGFIRAGLQELHFETYDDEQIPPVPHVFAVYQR